MRLSIVSFALLVLARPLSAAEPLILHVSPAGNDSWSGHLAAPNSNRTNGPLASLTGARDALRKARVSIGSKPVPATVRVQGGTYRLSAPFVLEPQDSGSSDAPVMFEAEPGQAPVFSGGRALTGFKQRGNVWETTVPEVKSGHWYFRQLFVNGQRRQRAHSPNTGFHRIANLVPGPKEAQKKPYLHDRFVFAPGDFQSFARLRDVNVTLMHSWETSIHPVKSVNLATNTVQFTAPIKEWWGIGYWEKAQRYTIENALELLDTPGEWYLNRETGVLTYWPMPGEKLGETEVVAPFLTELVRFAGNADQGRFVEHVALRGLKFHHADWELAPNGNSSTQAAVEVPAVIVADGARHVALEGCEVAHTGTYGLWFRRGCKDCRVQRNRLFDLGAGGIRVGETSMAPTDDAETSRILVDNNHIFDGGHVYAAGIGIWVAQSSHNVVSHNDIHDLLYSGMSLGWNWGLEPNRTHHNTVEWNHIHHLVHGTLSDAGLIYCLGVSPGSIIRNNVLHDIWPYTEPALGWGIYLDGQCGGYLVENNLVFNTLCGGLMFNNGGHAHTIRNNIFALSARQALWPYSEKRPSTLRHNIVYLTQGELLIPHGERSLNERLAAKEPPGDWDENLYWHTGGADELRFYRHTFPEWQALGLDPHSRIADPLFMNPAGHDFRLQPGSPALSLGFQPFDLSAAGLYGDAAWAAESRHEKCPHTPLPPPPPPPKPLELDDGFESTPLGGAPAEATLSGLESGAAIAVSTERAASGQRSLKVTDSKTIEPSWQPHFYYQPHHSRGTVRFSFDVWMEPGAQIVCEWRDAGPYAGNTGPSVRFDPDGKIVAAGRTIATIPIRTWIRVEMMVPLGRKSSRSYQLTVTPKGQPSTSATGLPFVGKDFAELHWLGFISSASADTAFYLDNLKLSSTPPLENSAEPAKEKTP